MRVVLVCALALCIGWVGSGLIEQRVISERHETMVRTFWAGTEFESEGAKIYWSPTRGLAHHVCTRVECYPFYEDVGYRCVSTGGKWDELTGCER